MQRRVLKNDFNHESYQRPFNIIPKGGDFLGANAMFNALCSLCYKAGEYGFVFETRCRPMYWAQL